MSEHDPPVTSDADAIKLAKRVLRGAVALRRDTRSDDQRRDDDLARLSLLRERLLTRPLLTVACYLSAGSEPATLPLVAWLAARDCRILLPLLTDDDGRRRVEPAWAEYAGPDRLRKGHAGIVEPDGPAFPGQMLEDADVVVCPGIAGTETGDRLGRGGGWYDRVLGFATGPVWLLLNDDEVFPELPTASWDRPVDAVVTPTRFIAVHQADIA